MPKGEYSLLSSAGDLFRKALLLAAASYFEHRVSSCVYDYAFEAAGGSMRLVSLIKTKAIERQYHTWFNWSESNANQFFALFGVEFKDYMKGLVRIDVTLQVAIQSFLEIGRSRNLLVHLDFATYSVDKTMDEIYESYKKALPFVDRLGELLRVAH